MVQQRGRNSRSGLLPLAFLRGLQGPLGRVSLGLGLHRRLGRPPVRQLSPLELGNDEKGSEGEQEGEGAEGRGRQPLPPAFRSMLFIRTALDNGWIKKCMASGGCVSTR
jgi:hypothetical protein